MTTGVTEKDILHSLNTLFSELMEGTNYEGAWVLNAGDQGLLKSIAGLSARQASSLPVQGGASIAAHIDHLRYGISLLNRWNRGEKPFADADYSQSWTRLTVSDEEWRNRQAAFKEEADQFREALANPREMDNTELTGVIGSIVHLGYHLGAIRQMDRSLRGPHETGPLSTS